jgi:DNA invertase Pin-like site-specific DNA recombinase
MVKYVLEEDVDVVFVQYLDRFGRNPQEILQRIWQLKDHGVSVEATDQDIQDELILMVMAGVAGHESKRTSERVRANMGNIVKRGIHSGKPPFGFRSVREIVDGHARVVRWGSRSLKARSSVRWRGYVLMRTLDSRQSQTP